MQPLVLLCRNEHDETVQEQEGVARRWTTGGRDSGGIGGEDKQDIEEG